MKNKKLLLAIALCAGLQGNKIINAAQNEKSYWEQYAPTVLQNTVSGITTRATQLGKAFQDRINNWSTRRKVGVAVAVLASLALIYNRDTLVDLVEEARYQAGEMLRDKNAARTYKFFGTDVNEDGTINQERLRMQVDNFKRQIGSSDNIYRWTRSHEREGFRNIKSLPAYQQAIEELQNK